MSRLTEQRLTLFCNGLVTTGAVDRACRKAGVSRSAVYARRKSDPVFAAAWDRALDIDPEEAV